MTRSTALRQLAAFRIAFAIALAAIVFVLLTDATARAAVAPPAPVFKSAIPSRGTVAPGLFEFSLSVADAQVAPGDRLDLECAVDGGDWWPCGAEFPDCTIALDASRLTSCNQNLSFGPYRDGEHEIRARAVIVENYECTSCAVPATLNGPEAVFEFVVDSGPLAPVIRIGGPGPLTTQSRAIISWTSPEPLTGVVCLIDGTDRYFAKPCQHNTIVGPLSPGPHSVTVYGFDAAGNRSFDTVYEWTQLPVTRVGALSRRAKALKKCKKLRGSARRRACVKRARRLH